MIFYYPTECWFTLAKTVFYRSHEPNNKGFRFASLASVHCHSTANIIVITGKISRNNDDSELLV